MALGVLLAPLRAETVYAIDSRSILLAFDTDRPGAIRAMTAVRGLQPGEMVLGLDFRPANKRLYALGSSSRLYILDPVTGAATPIGEGPFRPALEGTRFGFSFNPTVDRIRLVSNTGQNLRLHPDTGAVAATDMMLNYEDGMMAGVVAAGYTNSVAGATTTTLYNFDFARKALVIQNPPNDGRLSIAIRLPDGANFTDVSAFDISAATGRGYLATREAGAPRVRLYEVNLTERTLTLTGQVAWIDQITAMAVAPEGLTPLFDRLGGLPAISAVIDDFLGVVLADDRIKGFFAATVASPERTQTLRQGLIDLVCAGSGGPCEYKGRSMAEAHQGMQLSDVEFDALVDDLLVSLDKFQVPAPEKAALIGVLAPMRGDIVEKKQMQLLRSPAQ
jgi:truncated hemoglobin YjbI